MDNHSPTEHRKNLYKPSNQAKTPFFVPMMIILWGFIAVVSLLAPLILLAAALKYLFS